jgi:hypothetical protein
MRQNTKNIFANLFFVSIISTICLFASIATQAQTATHPTPFDFDNDGKTDLTVWRPSDKTWYIFQSQSSTYRIESFGDNTSDKIVPGDYDNHNQQGKCDIAVFRISDGVWKWKSTETGAVTEFQFGINGDQPIAGDYDGDSKTDYAVFRPSNNTWYIRNSGNLSVTIQQFGLTGDIPVRGDFDGDGKADIGVWRPSTGQWIYIRSNGGQIVYKTWGLGSLGDTVGTGDYDGDGKTDLCVWRSTTGVWYALKSSDESSLIVAFGGNQYGDVPAPGQYDTDNKTDFAVWRVPTATWNVLRSSDNYTTFYSTQFGSQAAGDKIAPAAFIATGAIAGTIKNSANSAINNAKIEVYEQSVLKTSAISGSDGYYSVPGLFTSKYEVRVYATGHKEAKISGVNVNAGGTTTTNVTLAQQTVKLEDNFDNGTTLDPNKWVLGLLSSNGDDSVNVAQTNQRIEITFPLTVSPSDKFRGIRSVNPNTPNTFDLTNSSVSVRVVDRAKGGPGNISTRIEIGTDNTHCYRIDIGNPDAYVYRVDGNSQTPIFLGRFPWSPTATPYIRIRHSVNSSSQNEIHFETSPTGEDETWTRVTNDPVIHPSTSFSLTAVHASLNAGQTKCPRDTEPPAPPQPPEQCTGNYKAIFDDFKFVVNGTANAKAGDDKFISQNLTSSVTLDSTGSTGTSYKWTLASKPDGAPDPTINSPTGASTIVNGLTFVGYYNF